MYKLALVALFCAQAFANPIDGDIESRVSGGSRAKEGEFPFSVSLRVPTGVAYCGGALISDRFVLTTAHCAEGQKKIKIGAGSVDLSLQKVYDVDQIIIHPAYDEYYSTDDIAILRLKTPVKLGGNITAIDFTLKADEKLEGKTVTALGYGKIDPNSGLSEFLYYVNRPVISNSECASRLDMKVTDKMFCTRGERGIGMLSGDEGSPAVYKASNGKTYIAGMYTFGVPAAFGDPDLFTRVGPYAEWIKRILAAKE